jgi:23S rRNA-/tRNA-specific pseudouridylate synthase/ubiquinone/menaquinone biosynthesis C-methylase UbiE
MRKTPRQEPRRGRPGLAVVHEDEHVLVVDKPAGLLTATLPGQPGTSLFDLVKRRVRDQVRRRGARVWIIHRLDKEVSGLVVFAKTEAAFGVLKEEFRTKRAHRLYEAVVEGEIQGAARAAGGRSRSADGGTIKSFLYEDERGFMRSTSTPTAVRAPRGKGEDEGLGPRLAVTHYRVIAAGLGRSLVQIRLETGRKNQIRVHMADIRHPIVGDRRYGASSDPVGRVCLHAAELGFTHPATGQSLRFHSEPPASFRGLVGLAPQPPRAGAQAPPVPAPIPATRDSWDHVASWYDDLLEERGSDHHERVILPGVLRLLGAKSGERVLDLACGQGILSKRLAGLGVRVVGVDASPKLIAAASRAVSREGEGPAPEFMVGDARDLPAVVAGPFDAAACVMALMNIEPLEPVLRGVASLLKPGGACVAVVLHPAFRAPGQTSWEWDRAPPARGDRRTRGPAKQFRRVDGYLTPAQREIVMNPGAAAAGDPRVTTITYHRPIQHYVRAFVEAGLRITALEEWPSARTSQPGPRAAEENRARREIPLFLAIKGVRDGA